MEQPSRIKLQVWLVISLVFVLGAVTGASLDRFYQAKTASRRPFDRDRHNGGPGGPPGRMLGQMTKELNLTTEQTEALRKIFEESRKDFSPSKLAECPGFKEAKKRTNDQIMGVLNPEQQKRFNEMQAERENRMKNGFPPPPPQ